MKHLYRSVRMSHTTKKIVTILCLLALAPANATAENPQNYEAHFNLGNEFLMKGELNNAHEQYSRAIALNPGCSQAHFNKGLAFVEQGNTQEAIASFNRATTINPNYTKAFVNLANAYHKTGDLTATVSNYRKALAIDPYYYDALRGLGKALNEQSNFKEAIEYLRQAALIRPDDLSNLLDLANTLNMANHTHEALAAYQQILTRAPNNTAALYNTAYTLKKLERLDEAMPYYEKVLQLEPNYHEAQFSLSLAYLVQGDFERGWPAYEARWYHEGKDERRVLSRPAWDGSSLQGLTLLLHTEQGYGDSLEFIRYAHEAKKRGAARVVVAAQDALVNLFRLCPYIDDVQPFSGPLGHFDTHAPLLSMPYLLKTTLDTVPHEVPYLFADPALVDHWKEQLAHDTNFKVGICWQGNANYSTHFLRTAVAAKSIRLEKFAPLARIANVSIYSLQKTTGEEQLRNMPEGFILHQFDETFDQKHGRFMDTAAVMILLRKTKI